MHGQKRGKKITDYGLQLREKQKAKRIYGVMEKQFRNYFQKAERQKGITGLNLLISLERRLDNMVYRMGFTSSRSEARQLVLHGHFLVNGKKVDIPSYLTNMGDVILVREKSRRMTRIIVAMERFEENPQSTPWVKVDRESFKGEILVFPTREEMAISLQEQLIVELYSK
jgi:small subunit ribosomal protein S4